MRQNYNDIVKSYNDLRKQLIEAKKERASRLYMYQRQYLNAKVNILDLYSYQIRPGYIERHSKHLKKTQWHTMPAGVLNLKCEKCPWKWSTFTDQWFMNSTRRCSTLCSPVDNCNYMFYQLNDPDEYFAHPVYIARRREISDSFISYIILDENSFWVKSFDILDDFALFMFTRKQSAKRIQRWYRRIAQKQRRICVETARDLDVKDIPDGAEVYF